MGPVSSTEDAEDDRQDIDIEDLSGEKAQKTFQNGGHRPGNIDHHVHKHSKTQHKCTKTSFPLKAVYNTSTTSLVQLSTSNSQNSNIHSSSSALTFLTKEQISSLATRLVDNIAEDLYHTHPVTASLKIGNEWYSIFASIPKDVGGGQNYQWNIVESLVGGKVVLRDLVKEVVRRRFGVGEGKRGEEVGVMGFKVVKRDFGVKLLELWVVRS